MGMSRRVCILLVALLTVAALLGAALADGLRATSSDAGALDDFMSAFGRKDGEAAPQGQTAASDGARGATFAFADAAIEAAAREALGKGAGEPVYADELSRIVSIDVANRNAEGKYMTDANGDFVNGNVSDISDLARFTGLKKLNISLNRVMDLAPLANLTQLEELYAIGNGISDLSPLAGLSRLNVLYLNENRVSDLSPLAGLNWLTVLNVADNRVTDLTPLAGLRWLDKLYLYSNQISDIAPLAGLNGLSELDVSYNMISDISPLSALTGLKSLWVERNLPLADITPLSGLTGLTKLTMHSDGITDVTPLAGLRALTELDLRNNSIADVTPLAGLSRLTSLYLVDNPFTDATPLAGLAQTAEITLPDGVSLSGASPTPGAPAVSADAAWRFADANIEAAAREALGKGAGETVTAGELATITSFTLSDSAVADLSDLAAFTGLEQLILEGDQISDVTPLAGLTRLKELSLENNPLSDATPLAGLTGLEQLTLSSTGISDLAPLAGLTNLRWLLLSFTDVSDVTPLAGLTRLDWLDLWHCRVSDISALSGLTNMETLWLNQNSIGDISAVRNMTRMTWFQAEGNDISDISPLANLTMLERLNLKDNPIADASPLAGLTKLTEVELPEGLSIGGGAAAPVPTAVSTPVPTPEPNALRRGSSGDDVAALQMLLVEHNYLNDVADGQFGGKTEAAVKAVQAEAGYEQSGVADSATLAYLQDHSAEFVPAKDDDILFYALTFDPATGTLKLHLKNTGRNIILNATYDLVQCNSGKGEIGSFFGKKNTKKYTYTTSHTQGCILLSGMCDTIEMDLSEGTVRTFDKGEEYAVQYLSNGRYAKVTLKKFGNLDSKESRTSQTRYAAFR